MVAVAAADVMVVAAAAAAATAANIVIAAMNINCNGMLLLLYAFRICCGRPGTTANR